MVNESTQAQRGRGSSGSDSDSGSDSGSDSDGLVAVTVGLVSCMTMEGCCYVLRWVGSWEPVGAGVVGAVR